MIVFDLKCSQSHVFEAWFGSNADYDAQKERGLLSCPICGDVNITKSVMAPRVGRKGNQSSVPVVEEMPAPPAATVAAKPVPAPAIPATLPAPSLPPEAAEKLTQLMGEMRTQVEKHCDYVGDDFAEEARKIHYGEADERGIYGQTTMEEAIELDEEGIEIVPLPLPAKPPRSDA